MPKPKSFIQLGALAAALCLTACASTGGLSGQGDDISPTARLYGDYLAANYASELQDDNARAQYFDRAFARKPTDLSLGQKALAAALNTGNIPLARTLAINVQTLEPTDGLSRAVLAAGEMQDGKYTKALDLLGQGADALSEEGSDCSTPSNIYPHGSYIAAFFAGRGLEPGVGFENICALMRGWSHAGAGDFAAAESNFKALTGGKYFTLIGNLQIAKLYAARGQTDKASELLSEIGDAGIATIETAILQAKIAAKAGDNDKAKAVLEAYADESGGALTGPVRALLDVLAAGGAINTDFPANEMAASAITEPAFGYYGVQNWDEAAEVFLRIAIEIDPDNHKARLFLGSTLEKMGRNDDALAQYRLIPDSSDYVVSTRLSQARLYFEDEKDEQGLAVLNEIYAAKPSRVTQEAVGRAYLILEDYGNAIGYYDALIADMSLEERKANPQAHYVRGICLERLGRWTEAVADFEFVLANAPDNADALNYLGYTWVDKGVELTRAFDMINKAVELQPDSGAIVDSLGWAYYKLGQYSKALIHLEDAVVLSPSSATIVDHLGDVYWKIGRRKEAGYQWERALTLDPTDEEIETIKAKLAGGLSAVSK